MELLETSPQHPPPPLPSQRKHNGICIVCVVGVILDVEVVDVVVVFVIIVVVVVIIVVDICYNICSDATGGHHEVEEGEGAGEGEIYLVRRRISNIRL